MNREITKASPARSPTMWIDPSVTSPARLVSSVTTLPHSTMTGLGQRTVGNRRSTEMIRFLQLRSPASVAQETRSLQAVTRDIPIVFLQVQEPVALGCAS